MYVLEVIPLSRTAPPEPLSYRSKQNLQPGTLVEISLRRKNVLGLVVGSEPVQNAKATLKNATFVLSKSAARERGGIPPALRTAATTIATYHATTIGSVLSSLIPPIVPEASDLSSAPNAELPTRLKRGDGFVFETIEEPRMIREQTYEHVLENAGIVLLVVPTIAEAKSFAERLRKYHPLVLTSALTPKKREQVLAAAYGGRNSDDIPLRLLITTPTFSYIPIPNLTHIILERVSAGGYLLPKRPYIDMRIALLELAKTRDISITYADYPLPLEYRSRRAKPLRADSRPYVQVIDARAETARAEGERWQAIPTVVRKEIKDSLKKDDTVAVLAARRGYAPTVVCRDCGTTVMDEYNRTLSLTMNKGRRVLRSADGKTSEDIDGKKILCKNCGSWNLMPLGVGIERIVEELRAEFPTAQLIQVDSDTLSAKIQKELLTPAPNGRLIIGTELMLPFLSVHEPVGLAIIASADSLLSVPFWRARERFVRIGLMLAERSHQMIVVTRQPDDSALSAITTPTTSIFWEEELGLRKMLSYPPFGTIIVFHIETTSSRIEATQKLIAELCAPYTIVILPARVIGKNLVRTSMVMQLPKDAWPDKALAEKLSFLPPYVRVHIDSETFF